MNCQGPKPDTYCDAEIHRDKSRLSLHMIGPWTQESSPGVSDKVLTAGGGLSLHQNHERSCVSNMDDKSSTQLGVSYKNRVWGSSTDRIRIPNPSQFQLIPFLFGSKYSVELQPNAPQLILLTR